MPIYEYVCNDCQARYERIVISARQEIECPKCASKRHTLQLSVFSAGKSANGTASSSATSASRGCGCMPHSCGCR
jgi:putative FmdB family regulatory protein